MINKCHTRYCSVCRSSRAKVLCKKSVLRNFAKDLVCNFIKNGSLAQMFSCEFCEVSNSTFFNRTPSVGAFVVRNTKKMKHFQQKGNLKKSKRNRVNFFNTYIVVFAFLSSVVEVGRLQKLNEMFVFGIFFICQTATTFMKIFMKSFQE